MNAVDIMVREHENITRMLKVMRKACLNIMEGKNINFDDFTLMIDFVRNYSDNHHHKKEEIMLFNRMTDNLGPAAEKLVKHGMLVEHDMGRMFIRDLETALESVKQGNNESKLDVIANAISYTHLLERHIDKENNVVYKFALRELNTEIINAINNECTEYEKENINTKDKYINILEKLEQKYL